MKSQKKITFWTLLLLCISFVGNSYAQELAWQALEIGGTGGQYQQIQFLGNFGWVIRSTEELRLNELWLTEDEGKSWFLSFSAPKSRNIFDVRFINPKEGWLVLGIGPSQWSDLFRTQDGGRNWEPIDYRLEHNHPKPLCCVPSLQKTHFFDSKEGIAYFAFLGAVFHEAPIIARSEDGGKTWKQISLLRNEIIQEIQEIIDIVMPIKEGRYLPQEVFQALLAQGMPFRLFVSTKVSNGDYPAARNNVKQYGKSDFILMLDNDIVLPPEGLRQMIEFLQTHPEYGAIGIPKQEFLHRSEEDMLHSEHVDMSCVLFRREVLEKLIFCFPQTEGYHPGGSCECSQACRDIRAMGLEIGFLPHLLAQHIYSTQG